uniref:Uncharacterized protein n=1 Tax=Rhizophora mucronata TaxID=61149 RepID=A0A2P2P7S2_RHIMU
MLCSAFFMATIGSDPIFYSWRNIDISLITWDRLESAIIT